MTVEEIKNKIRDLFDELASPLPRNQYREIVEEMHCDMQCRLDCLKEEDEVRE
jgi:hypothetical protein